MKKALNMAENGICPLETSLPPHQKSNAQGKGAENTKEKIQAVLYGRRERSAPPPPPSSYFYFCFVFYEVVIIKKFMIWLGTVIFGSTGGASLSLSSFTCLFWVVTHILRSSQGKMRSI